MAGPGATILTISRLGRPGAHGAKGMFRRGPVLAAAAAALLLLIPLHPRPLLVWNATASAPVGLYAVTASVGLAAGDLVLAWPPAAAARLAAARHYLPRGVPVVKRIAALPGEQVCASGDVVRGPRGIRVRRLARDSD